MPGYSFATPLTIKTCAIEECSKKFKAVNRVQKYCPGCKKNGAKWREYEKKRKEGKQWN